MHALPWGVQTARRAALLRPESRALYIRLLGVVLCGPAEKAEHAAVGWDATRYQGHWTEPKSSVGILKNGSGPSHERQPPAPPLVRNLRARRCSPEERRGAATAPTDPCRACRACFPQAHTLGKNHLPGSLEQCHDLILDLQAQLRSTEMLDAFEIEKKEQTIEGISDMFALSALLPDKTRMYREYNEMKVKYQENLEQLTRLQAELLLAEPVLPGCHRKPSTQHTASEASADVPAATNRGVRREAVYSSVWPAAVRWVCVVSLCRRCRTARSTRRPPEVGCDIRRLSCPHRFLQDSHDPSGFEW